MAGEMMVGFGPKQGWLAVRDGEPTAAFEALGARMIGPMSWRSGMDRAYTSDDLVVATPPLPGARDSAWMLVAGRWFLVNEASVDVGAISAILHREVQFFATYRVSELHRWDRAVSGMMIRSFRYLGETGGVTDWHGDPDAAELEIGLPLALDTETGVDRGIESDFDAESGDGRAGSDSDILVDEGDVLRIAAAWSIDPTALGGRPASGPLLAAAL